MLPGAHRLLQIHLAGGHRAHVHGVSIFGGIAEPVALWFKSIGHEPWFYCYLTGCIAVSLLVYTLMRDTKKNSAIET